MSWPASSRWVAKLWRKVWQLAGLTIPARLDGAADELLEGGLGQMMPSLDPRARVDRSPGRGEDVLPGGLAIGVGILLGQGVGEVDAAEPLGDIAFVPAPDAGDLILQGFRQRPWQEGHAVLLPLAVADDEVVLAEIDVLDPEAEAFHQPQTGAVEQAGHEEFLAVELGQDGADLGAREDDGQPSGPLRPAGVDATFQRPLEDDLIEEEQRAHRLVLGRCGDVLVDRQMGEEGFDFALAHLRADAACRGRR